MGKSQSARRPVNGPAKLAARRLDQPGLQQILQPPDLKAHGRLRSTRGMDGPLALASVITPKNADDYCGLVDCFLVATGINDPGDF